MQSRERKSRKTDKDKSSSSQGQIKSGQDTLHEIQAMIISQEIKNQQRNIMSEVTDLKNLQQMDLQMVQDLKAVEGQF